jgi:hypothetical protein
MSATLLATLLGIGAAAGTRSSLTVLVLAVAARFSGFELPQDLQILASDLGLASLLALVVLDELVERDPDLQGLLVLVNVGVRGAGGMVAAWGLQDTMDESLPQPVVWAIGGAAAIGVHLLRTKVQTYIPAARGGLLDPRAWLGWLEVGGVMGLVAAVLLAPLLALGFVVLASAASVLALIVGRNIERARHRRPCPHCRHWTRMEATRCPRCHQDLPIARWLR